MSRKGQRGGRKWKRMKEKELEVLVRRTTGHFIRNAQLRLGHWPPSPLPSHANDSVLFCSSLLLEIPAHAE